MPQNEWLTPVWPNYQCKNCGAKLEEDERGIFHQSLGIALIIGLTQFIGGAVGYFVSDFDDFASDVGRWIATGIGLVWYFTKPKKLGVIGAYAKQRESSNK